MPLFIIKVDCRSVVWHDRIFYFLIKMIEVAPMKKVITLMAGCFGFLAAAHTCEWFFEGRQVAAAAGIPVRKALPQCLLRGFLWWKPLKKKLGL